MKNETIQVIKDIENDFIKQDNFIVAILTMLENIALAKRDMKVTDLEIGFKIGILHRMFEEYISDQRELYSEVKQVFKIFTEFSESN